VRTYPTQLEAMVELTLDSIEDGMMPKDIFISVRVGDKQKLSKLAATQVYRFPQAGSRRFGKVDVLKRIGTCSIVIDPTITGAREVRVSCEDNTSLGLRIGVEADETQKKAADEIIDPDANKKSRVKAAREYLSQHGLEVHLSEAVQDVLRERPENPTEYLALKLLGKSGRELPQLQGASKPEGPAMPSYQQDRSLPTDELYKTVPHKRPQQLEPLGGKDAQHVSKPAPVPAPPVTILPFKAYYSKHFCSMPAEDFQSTYSKFPPPKQTIAPVQVLPFPAFYNRNFKSAGPAAFNKLYQSFPRAAAKPQKTAAQAVVFPFNKYYKANIAKQVPLQALFNIYKMFPSAALWVKKPSIGTWISALPLYEHGKKVNRAAPAAPQPASGTGFMQKASVGTWISALPLYEHGKKVNQAAPAVPQAASGTGDAYPEFMQKASVITWCTPHLGAKPMKAGAAKTSTSYERSCLRLD